MSKKTAPLLPPTNELLHQFGDRLCLARRRRRLSAKQVAERAGMSPMTLRSLERGGSGVTMGAYLAVMQVLGIETDLDLLAKADPLGRELQDARLPAVSKTTARVWPASPASPTRPKRSAPVGDAVTEWLANSPQAQMRKMLEALPSEQLRKALEALPETQMRMAIAALPQAQLRVALDALEAPTGDIKMLLKSTENEQSWREQSGFADSETLARLIDPLASSSKNRG